MLCSSEQQLMGRNLDTESSNEGDNAPPEYFENQVPQIGSKCICHATSGGLLVAGPVG